MAAPEDARSDRDTPNGDPSPEWYQEQWSTLCEVLDVSAPDRVVPRVRALQESVSSISEQATTESPVAAEEVEAALQDMHEQLQTLRARNDELVDRLDDADAPSDALHPDTEALLDDLDASSPEEARERVESLTQQLQTLRRDKEQLAEAGFMGADEALDEIDRLQAECDRLRDERDQLEREADGGPDTADLRAASALRRITGVSSPDEAHDALSQARQAHDDLAALLREAGLDAPPTASETDDLGLTLQTVADQAALLRENADSPDTSGDGLPAEVGEVLGVATVEEAEELRSMVRRMTGRMEELAAEQETLAEAGLTAEQAVSLIDTMDEQLNDLYEKIEAEPDASPSVPSPDDAPATDDTTQIVVERLGVSTPEEARDLSRMVRRMSEQLDDLRAERQALTARNLTAEEAIDMIDSMEEQLNDLYEARDERAETLRSHLQSLGEMVGTTLPDPLSLEASAERLADALQGRLADAQSLLPAEAEPLRSVDALLEALDDRLSTLVDERDTLSERADRLVAIEDALGIASVEEAEELARLTQNMDEQLRSMDEQLNDLYAEKAKLEEVGVSNVGDAVSMINSMEEQLDELYQEQEAVEQRSLPESAQQDTFEQLESLYTEQEKLERRLGVSDADDVIEMVEALEAQLEDLYAERDAERDDSPPTWIGTDRPDEHAPGTDATGDGVRDAAPETDSTAASQDQQTMLASMRQQLEMLYEEKEALLDRGLRDAQEAADHIDTLREEVEDCRARTERLESELGTADVGELVQMVADLRTRASAVPLRADVPSPPEQDPQVDAAPPVVPEDTLDQLDTLDTDALDDLSVGALRLDDDGTIAYANEPGLQLPGLTDLASPSDAVGRNLFEVVPSTSNNLFLGRFKEGVQQDALDARFPYTFVHSGRRPVVLPVHLYRTPSGTNWLFFQPA